jgi:hypothetical protein
MIVLALYGPAFLAPWPWWAALAWLVAGHTALVAEVYVSRWRAYRRAGVPMPGRR